MKYLFSDS